MHSTISRRSLSPVVTVDVSRSVYEGLELMSTQNIGSLVVVSQEKPVGILTERDVVFAANWMLGQPDLTVGQVMNKEVVTVDKGISFGEACVIFRDQPVRHLVVVDRQGHPTGLFTQTTLVQALDKKIFPEEMTVEDLMSRRVWQVASKTSARYALSLMARHAISGVLVVGAQGPVGFFSEKHVVRLITSGADLDSCYVGESSLSEACGIDGSAHPVQAINLMKKKSVRRLLVCNAQGETVGVLSKTDLSRNLDCGRVPDGLPELSVRAAASVAASADAGLRPQV